MSEEEGAALMREALTLGAPFSHSLCGHSLCVEELAGRVIFQDLLDALPHLPSSFIDLLIIDPPYNLSKTFGARPFPKTPLADYEEWLDGWLVGLKRCLKPSASLYVCCDWRSSSAVQAALSRHFIVRNRITWEREKGRGATRNWKAGAEDIWFCTASGDYHFDVEAVKLKRRVVAPYRDASGAPRGWTEEGGAAGEERGAAGEERGAGRGYRLTHPSNLWTDISVPFWSMPENTPHPTQKPEKLIAKLILASSRPGDMVFDPCFGSGTTCVVAKKLGRRFSGVEREEEYCRLALKRLALADEDTTIQGYHDGCFWERNSRLPGRR